MQISEVRLQVTGDRNIRTAIVNGQQYIVAFGEWNHPTAPNRWQVMTAWEGQPTGDIGTARSLDDARYLIAVHAGRSNGAASPGR